jgi:hypothetical protein
MSILNQSGSGPEVKNQLGTVPAASSAGTVNGTGIDRRGFNFLILEAQTGVTTGTPTSFTMDVRLQHSDVVGSGYTDYQPGGVATAGAVAQITAASSRRRKQIDLRGAKAFVRVVNVIAFVGGTTPTLANVATMQLAGADVLPAQLDD